MRAGFDLLCERWNPGVKVSAEADDMAMLRVLARSAEDVPGMY